MRPSARSLTTVDEVHPTAAETEAKHLAHLRTNVTFGLDDESCRARRLHGNQRLAAEPLVVFDTTLEGPSSPPAASHSRVPYTTITSRGTSSSIRAARLFTSI